MTNDIVASWGRVERWSTAHAPASLSRLNPPASPEAIAEAQENIGVAFPADLVELLGRHNGVREVTTDDHDVPAGADAFLPGGHVLIGTADIVREHRMLTEILNELDDESHGDMIGVWWHPKWVPFARHIAADALFVDQRPGDVQGSVGEFLHEDSASLGDAPSLAAYFHAMAESLETGTDLVLGDVRYRPSAVADGTLDWEIITD